MKPETLTESPGYHGFLTVLPTYSADVAHGHQFFVDIHRALRLPKIRESDSFFHGKTGITNIMSASIFSDNRVEPDDSMLAHALGDTKTCLDAIAEFIGNEYGDPKTEWKFYNKKSGWILKMFTGTRNVLFVIPCDQHFRVSFTFGKRASDLVFRSDLPDSVRTSVIEAKKFAEGRTIQVEVRSEKDLDTQKMLIRIKLMD